MKKFVKKLRWHHPILVIFLALFVVAAVVFFSRLYAFNQIGSNIYLNDVPVSGLSYDSASEIIEETFNQYLQQPVTIVVNETIYNFSPQDLGIEFDTLQTVEAIYLQDYGPTFFDGVKSQLYRLFDDIKIQPAVHSDLSKFKKTLQANIEDLKNPQNASITVNDDNLFTVTSHSNGLNASYQQAYASIVDQAFAMQSMSVKLDTEITYPNVTADQATAVAALANEYTAKEITLQYNDNYLDKTYSLQILADWLTFPEKDGVLSVEIDHGKLAEYLGENIAPDIDQPSQNAIILSLPTDETDYVRVEGIAKDGIELDLEKTAQEVVVAINQGQEIITLPVNVVEGKIINETGVDLGELKHLATGASNWEGSPDGRDFNIRKGLSEKVNNILLEPGQEYNFNKNLGPVTHSAGWKDSLAIFGGKNLVPVPGGGLCQVSTTIYRAAINAGLEITERSNHSLYVHYYKAYGDGLDAAIYPGSKNLKFVNNTGNYLLIQAYDDGFDGYVRIYGTPDGRSTALEGPFYPKNIPVDWQDKISLRYNQIGWWYTIYDLEGKVIEEKQLTGTYRSIPY